MPVSLIYLLTFTLLLVNGTTAQNESNGPRPPAATQTADRGRWRTLVSPDGDFKVDFPSMPDRIVNVEMPNGLARHYSVSAGVTLFQLVFGDSEFSRSGRAGNRLPADFTQRMLEQARREGWTVTRARLIRPDLYEQEHWSPTSDPGKRFNIISRHIMRNGRHYTLACSSLPTGEKVDANLCHRFFESFRILKAPQTR